MPIPYRYLLWFDFIPYWFLRVLPTHTGTGTCYNSEVSLYQSLYLVQFDFYSLLIFCEFANSNRYRYLLQLRCFLISEPVPVTVWLYSVIIFFCEICLLIPLPPYRYLLQLRCFLILTPVPVTVWFYSVLIFCCEFCLLLPVPVLLQLWCFLILVPVPDTVWFYSVLIFFC